MFTHAQKTNNTKAHERTRMMYSVPNTWGSEITNISYISPTFDSIHNAQWVKGHKTNQGRNEICTKFEQFIHGFYFLNYIGDKSI